MKKVFFGTHQGVRSLATFRGHLIVATSEEEISQGPPGEVLDLEEITVSAWLAEHGVKLPEKEA